MRTQERLGSLKRKSNYRTKASLKDLACALNTVACNPITHGPEPQAPRGFMRHQCMSVGPMVAFFGCLKGSYCGRILRATWWGEIYVGQALC